MSKIDIDIQDILKNHLIDAGYEVAVASDGVAGIAMFGDTIDLVLLDIMLPKIDGYGVCRCSACTEQTEDLTPECIFHGLTPLYLSSFFLYRRICIYELIVLFSILHQGRENKCFFYTIEIFLSRYAQMCNSSHHLKRWENSCYIC